MRVFLLTSAIAFARELKDGDKIPDGYKAGDYLVRYPSNDGPIAVAREEFRRHYVAADELQDERDDAGKRQEASAPRNLEREGNAAGSSSSSSASRASGATSSASAPATGSGDGSSSGSAESDELARLRQENEQLRRDRDEHARTHEGGQGQGGGQGDGATS